MLSVNIQFHMLFDELVDFVANVISQYSLSVELEKFYPTAIRQVSPDADLTAEVRAFGQVDRFWLLYKTPKSRKSERFMLNVGQQRGSRLAQAQFGAGTNKVKAFEVVKQVAANLKRRTTAGIWVVGETGTVGYVKKFRISKGATNAARTGKVDLVSPAFTQSFQVDPPEMEDS